MVKTNMIKAIVAIIVFLALIGMEFYALPWIEPLFGANWVASGPWWLLFPAVGGYIGWILTERVIGAIGRRKSPREWIAFWGAQCRTHIKEKLNTLPAIMQLLAALSLTSTVLNVAPEYNQFVHLFVFVTALVSMTEAYQHNENFRTTIFILIACLYNPFYPILFKINMWMSINCLVAFAFAYSVSFIRLKEKRLDKELLTMAIKIHARLTEIDKNTHQYTFTMLERYIKHKYPYLSYQPNAQIQWREKGLEDFTFTVLDVFNGLGAISVNGKNAFRGFSAFLVFHNQRVRWMIFLEKNASKTAKRLKKIMVKDLHYHCFEQKI